MGVGRFFCVALPFALTIGSLICLLIVMTAGMSSKAIDMYTINPQNLSITFNDLKNFKLNVDTAVTDEINSLADTNITAADLGLQNNYQVYMFNYCYQNATTNNTWCSKPKYNWASSALNTTELQANITAISLAVSNKNVTIPSSIVTALHAYSTISRWIQIVYIIAIALVALELFIGLFGFCSRAASCATYLVSGLSTTIVIAASVLSTVASAILVGALDATKPFGVKVHLDTSFLAFTWLAAAFSIGGGVFWLLSACCCANDRPHRRSEKYAPIQGQHGGPAQTHGAPVHNTGGAYEPYRTV